MDETSKVFLYGEQHGGIGDFVKSLKMYIEYSIKKNNKILITIENNSIKDLNIIKDKYKYNKSSTNDNDFVCSEHPSL